MTLSIPSQRVVSILGEAGYRLGPTPISIGSIPFEFTAVLVGAERALDLIVVIDTLEEQEDRVQQKVEALGRALDVAASRRSVTVVLVGPTVRGSVLTALTRVSRVLQIGTPTGQAADQFVRDAVSVLLPLKLPQLPTAVADPLRELRSRVADSIPKELLEKLLAAAPKGAAAVQEPLRGILAAPLSVETESETHD